MLINDQRKAFFKHLREFFVCKFRVKRCTAYLCIKIVLLSFLIFKLKKELYFTLDHVKHL